MAKSKINIAIKEQEPINLVRSKKASHHNDDQPLNKARPTQGEQNHAKTTCNRHQ